ncbi:MAG TPA: trypsin-like peptidase domain-containing protein [Thermoleophilia bacterium]|nr:trypsin-like peptidase domain-containing protein [Thermoleophilia bacterium]
MKSRFSYGPVTASRLTFVVLLALAALLGLAVGAGRWTWVDEAPAAAEDGLPADEVYRRAVEGVVKIVAFDVRDGDYSTACGEAGSGFVVADDGSIVTCAHVVSPRGTPVTRVRVVFRTGELGERSLEGAVVGVDWATDIAVVRVDPDAVELGVLPLGDSGGLEVGDTVYSLGNALDYDFSMTQGIVSALHRVLRGSHDALIRGGIQHDAAVNVGDSGGPLLDSQGTVVGVNQQIATPGGQPTGNAGLAFAVPVGTVKDVLHQLRTTGTVVRPWIAIEALTITPAAVGLLGLEVACGILVVDVTPDGPAAAAGLRGGDRQVAVPGQPGRTVRAGGDVITALDGRSVHDTDDLIDCVQALRPGDRLPVTYVRDGRAMTTVIVVGVRP